MTTEAVEQEAPTGPSTVALCAELGITYRQLDHWISRGYIGGGNPGSGHRRVLTDDEVRTLRYMVALTRAGLSVAAAADAALCFSIGAHYQLGPWCLTAPSDAAVAFALLGEGI